MTQEQKIKAIGLYIGAEFVSPSGAIWELVGLEVNKESQSYLIGFRPESGKAVFHVDACKILLNTLEDITDEDAIEVAKIEYGDNLIEENKISAVISSGKMVVFRIKDNDIPYCSLRVADYLRSKFYCLPYLGFDLVKEGIAVLKEK